MDTEQYVKEVLESHFKLKVEKIPEGDKRTPDFSAYNDKENYLIEVKEKGANPDHDNERELAFENNTIFQLVESLDSKSVLQNVVRDAKKQIDSYADDQDVFRVAWVHCTGTGFAAMPDKIITGLYGSKIVVTSAHDQAMTCYYFGFSQFYKYKDNLDAVMVSNQRNEFILCLNNFSPRYERIKESQLVLSMPKGVRDPYADNANGKAMIVDGEVDRRNSKEVLNFLKERYNLESVNILNMTHFEVHSSIPYKN